MNLESIEEIKRLKRLDEDLAAQRIDISKRLLKLTAGCNHMDEYSRPVVFFTAANRLRCQYCDKEFTG